MKNTTLLSILRIVALIALLIGAGGSFYLVLQAGRNNSSAVLRLLFVVWVLFPFAALLIADVVSRNWSAITRLVTYCLMLVITAGSLMGYSGMFSSPGTKPAAMFLLIPFIALLAMMIIIPITAFMSQKKE
ncbi:MAG: hypothetical protein JWP45_3467 [Mucilaginibacter sp.]|nr:hypothetical protein [Mucilaginibacter sp.]